jgi:hypothetical protein
MSYHHTWRHLLLLLGVAAALTGSVTAQDDAPDPRVLSIHYWQSFIDRGIVKGNPEVPIEPAVYTRLSGGPASVPNDPDILITGTLTNTTQSENSVFVDPLNNMRALNSNNSTNWPFSTLYGTSRYQTTNDGASWFGSVTSPAGDNIGDPAAAIGRNGYFYIGHITNAFGQAVSRSTDAGTTWTKVTLGSGGTLDKNHLWIDNVAASIYEGNVYSAWTVFSSPYGAIEVMRSTNDGTSWVNRTAVSAGVAAGSHNQGVNLQTGPNGEVYVCWAVYDVWSPPYNETAIGFTKSTNGGVSYATATRVQTITGIRGQGVNLGGSYPIRLASFPVMAVDRSSGERSGFIYIVWTQRVTTTNGSWDTYLIRSTDGGATWSPRILVGTEPSATNKKEFYPWITCDDETGNLSVIRYDNRDYVTSPNQVEVWLSESTDGGNTWTDSQLSDVQFTPSPIPGLASGYMGDYIAIAARGGRVYPVWTTNQATPVRAYTQAHDFGGGSGGGGIPCGDIASFQARCVAGGTIQARVNMTNLTHVGEQVEITIDGVPHVATIGANGVGARAQIAVGGFGSGPHTVELTDPAGCFPAQNVNCPTAFEKGDDIWAEDVPGSALPSKTTLLGNYPNPFNPSTTIRYALAADTYVSVKVYNMLGQEVATLVNGFQKAGEQSVIWNGTNNAGSTVASGLYIYKLQAGSVVLSEKMLFAK